MKKISDFIFIVKDPKPDPDPHWTNFEDPDPYAWLILKERQEDPTHLHVQI